MKLLSTSWFFGKWCAECLRDILLGALWLCLAGMLVVQIGLLTAHHLPMPSWMLRQIEARINSTGLSVQIDEATIDLVGRVSIKNLQITPQTIDTPLIKIEEVYLRLDPLALLTRQVDPRYIRATGVNLLLPAMLSPTGRTEAVLSNIRLAFKPDQDTIALKEFSGEVANLTFSARGSIAIPKELTRSSANKGITAETMSRALKTYVDLARKLSEITPELAALENPHLDLLLASDKRGNPTLSLSLISRKISLDLARFRPDSGRLQLTNLKLTTTVNLSNPTAQPLSLQGVCSEANTTKGYQLLGVNFSLKADPPRDTSPFKPLELIVKADTAVLGTLAGIDFRNSLIRLTPGNDSMLSTELTTEAIGTSWQVEVEANPARGEAQLKLAGAITPFIIRKLEEKMGMDQDTLLSMKTPIPITLTADFAQDWKLQKVLGRVSFGPVVGYSVPFTQGTASFSFDGTELSVTDIAASQGDHSAVGSYWMNIKTLDFRFLLGGHLRPMGIAGFFGPWWSNFFSLLDFTPVAPAASVDIGGRWTFPYTTTVFVNADAPSATINQVRFDRVRTTMFIRPNFYDALEFIVDQGEHSARGTFTRAVDIYRTADELRSIDLNLTSTLDLAEAAKIFGAAGAEIVEPFTFANPPTLQLNGRVDGPASERGPHRSIQMAVKSTGPFALYGFPLSDLSFNGAIKDDDIDLEDIQVSFARGLAQGHAYISGPEPTRKLSFDIALQGAYLGEAINTFTQFSAGQKGEPPTINNRAQQLAGIRLNVQLAATGLYHDPMSFQGKGSAELSGAELAKINLLGSLSQELSKNAAFRFTTIQLNQARVNLVLDRQTLSLPDLKISGNSVKIEADGSYLLDKNTVDFTAKVYPFGGGKTFLSSAVGFVLVPLSNALELKLSGSLTQPNWRFAYGPRNFLYNITGTNPNDAAVIPEQTPTDITRRLPPPYLRR